jgi:4-diphosphocytidyl-2-C-methyl-D-erythritol kinase
MEIFMAQGVESRLNRWKAMNSVTLDSPAKINLMLSVHGQRGDGFHALTSVVVALDFGDTLRVSLNDAGEDRLNCDDPAVPTGEANLIIKAASALRAALGEAVTFDFDLEKRIPMGAGLGGGSSNAAVALNGMNELTGNRLARASLLELAADLGSDCPFFIDAKPALMTGRGEVIEALPEEVAQRLRGQRALLFRPDFGVNTAWAYRQLLEASPSTYESEDRASARLRKFQGSGLTKDLLYNTFEENVGAKYLAIPCLLEALRAEEMDCLMSGSGSCCFALPRNPAEMITIRTICQKAWGSGAFVIETFLC